MQTLKATMWIERIGLTAVNAVLLAGLPLALISLLVQSF